MPTYETVFAVPLSLEGEEKQQSIKSVEDIISGAGGSVTSSQDMGEVKMAYKVKGHDRAYYHLIKFECPPSGVAVSGDGHRRVHVLRDHLEPFGQTKQRTASNEVYRVFRIVTHGAKGP